MKNIKCLVVSVSLVTLIGIPYQDILAQTAQASIICDSVSDAASGSLMVSALQLHSCFSEIEDIDSAKRLVHILNLDAVKYFDLARLYDSESKMSEYKQTKVYKDQLAALAELKKEAQSTWFYSVLTNDLGKFSWSFKGFKFAMDKLSTPGGTIGAPPPPSTMYYAIDLSKLPFAASGKTDQEMTITVDPESGMQIDRNKENIATVVIYMVGDVKPKEYSYYNEQCHCNRNAKEDVISVKYSRVIIYNNSTDEIYYDKIY